MLTAGGLVVLGQGCQDPTQITLELSLDEKAKCAEIANGTAITVGIEPRDTESRFSDGYVTAKTSDCDAMTGRIGTLVVTPSDAGRASVIVVVGYKGNDPTSCRPPTYAGCIVARRRFNFVDHTRLRMPISLDPDCANVPCDAFSTCSKGRCFDSETDCTGGECSTPGELKDGGVDEAKRVEPETGAAPQDGSSDATNGRDDAGPDATGADDGGLDATGGDDASLDATNGGDGGLDATPDGNVTVPYCNGDKLVCNSCGFGQFCCSTTECDFSMQCSRPPGGVGAPGTCQPVPDSGSDSGSTSPSCNGGTLLCQGNACTSPNACCSDTNQCVPGPCGAQQYCCTDGDCPSLDYQCNWSGGAVGTCALKPPKDAGIPTTYPYCDGFNMLHCTATDDCSGASNACCHDPDFGTVCTMGTNTCGGAMKYCCRNEDCPLAADAGPGVCTPGGPGIPGTCL